jgi:hypothetical protein
MSTSIVAGRDAPPILEPCKHSVSDRLWEIDDVVALVEANDPKPGRRGSL